MFDEQSMIARHPDCTNGGSQFFFFFSFSFLQVTASAGF